MNFSCEMEPRRHGSPELTSAGIQAEVAALWFNVGLRLLQGPEPSRSPT